MDIVSSTPQENKGSPFVQVAQMVVVITESRGPSRRRGGTEGIGDLIQEVNGSCDAKFRTTRPGDRCG